MDYIKIIRIFVMLKNDKIMEVLRKVDDVVLNEGDNQSRGLFNLYNEYTDEVSFWFDEEVKDELMEMTDEEFLNESKVKFEIANINQ